MSTDREIVDDVYVDKFKECIAFVEAEISSKRSYSEITRGIEILCGSAYDSVRVAFGKYMPIPLNTYVKRRVLTCGYLQAQREHPSLNRRSKYFGLKAFVEKFEREFDRSFWGQYTEDELQPEFIFSREST